MPFARFQNPKKGTKTAPTFAAAPTSHSLLFSRWSSVAFAKRQNPQKKLFEPSNPLNGSPRSHSISLLCIEWANALVLPNPFRSFGESFRFARTNHASSFLASISLPNLLLPNLLIERDRRHQGVSPCYGFEAWQRAGLNAPQKQNAVA